MAKRGRPKTVKTRTTNPILLRLHKELGVRSIKLMKYKDYFRVVQYSSEWNKQKKKRVQTYVCTLGRYYPNTDEFIRSY